MLGGGLRFARLVDKWLCPLGPVGKAMRAGGKWLLHMCYGLEFFSFPVFGSRRGRALRNWMALWRVERDLLVGGAVHEFH